ncbi:unnamed protein product [Cyprideis torosa]|uniref:Uncharacterized protein n=1 Tax=Cyprideis torosa TaxID=163714 RepID=A0A7R8ZKC8_9CRUS|nr:unnamed protein product [Cyprideis torosa]CAG0884202.1 unnamed protein product [Cyprideis torosa]
MKTYIKAEKLIVLLFQGLRSELNQDEDVTRQKMQRNVVVVLVGEGVVETTGLTEVGELVVKSVDVVDGEAVVVESVDGEAVVVESVDGETVVVESVDDSLEKTGPEQVPYKKRRYGIAPKDRRNDERTEAVNLYLNWNIVSTQNNNSRSSGTFLNGIKNKQRTAWAARDLKRPTNFSEKQLLECAIVLESQSMMSGLAIALVVLGIIGVGLVGCLCVFLFLTLRDTCNEETGQSKKQRRAQELAVIYNAGRMESIDEDDDMPRGPVPPLGDAKGPQLEEDEDITALSFRIHS